MGDETLFKLIKDHTLSGQQEFAVDINFLYDSNKRYDDRFIQ